MLTDILVFAALAGAVQVAIALGLLLSQPLRPRPARDGLDFGRILGAPGFEPPQSPAFVRASLLARDGARLDYTHVRTEGARDLPLVVMLHGSGWHGGQFDRLAWALRDVAEVKALTLRGHGANPQRRGDIDHLGQFEEDIADLVAGDPRRPILLGHSSGGGLVVRFAGGRFGRSLGGAILLAPFLHHKAPTTRRHSGGWAHVLTRRIIGLSMLNALGLRLFDHLHMIQFNMPKTVLEGRFGHLATTSYSWRLNRSYAPRRAYLKDVAALPRHLVIVGAADEAMQAEAYAPLMRQVTARGQHEIVAGAGHLDIVDHPRTEALIRRFLAGS